MSDSLFLLTVGSLVILAQQICDWLGRIVDTT